MSKQAQQSLGADLKEQQDKQGQKKRKMTAAILEEQERQKEKESHVIFEDDDDFEEFEIAHDQGADVDKQTTEGYTALHMVSRLFQGCDRSGGSCAAIPS